MGSGKGREEDRRSREWSIMGKKQLKKKNPQRKGKEFETITGSNYVCT